MMIRRYGRRSRGLERSYSGANSFGDGVSDSSSQECPQDVCDFTFPSQDSTRCHWSDPYGFSSSQDSRQLEFLPASAGGDFDGGVWKSKKAKVIEVDSEPYGSSSSQESKEFEVLEISGGDFQKSKKLKKVNSDPYEYKSSEETEEFVVMPQRKGREKGIFEFSEDEDLWKSKGSKNVSSDSYVLHTSKVLANLGIPSSRKHEGNGDCKEFDGAPAKSKKKDMGENGVLQKKKKKKKKMKAKASGADYVELTSTLMETQEFGEMMENLDEVNFALDGLKKGQPIRIRRASLLSLLTICRTSQQRRLLRAHGMAKTVTDALLELILDDLPSNLAAAALFYILTSDGQDDNLLHSPNCIRFLIKLLKPHTSPSAKNKDLPIGSKLLGICKNAGLLQESSNRTDSSSIAIMLKVREMLDSCKEMKPRDDNVVAAEEPELNPKWISLLIMEKACLSSIPIEDSSGTVRKTGANFKEKLREFGGLDAVFEVARNCHSIMEESLQKSPTDALDSKDISGLASLVVLLKCLKIMENATFLSNDNQCHLLGMKGTCNGQQAPRSFTKLVLSVIKILSGVSLLRSALGGSQDEKMGGTSNGNSHSGTFEFSPEATEVSADPMLRKLRVESSQAGSCRETSWSLDNAAHISNHGSKTEAGISKRQLISTNSDIMEDIQDPFAFHEDDFKPSKWDLLSGSVKKSLSQDSRVMRSEYKDVSHSMLMSSQQESNNVEYRRSQETSCLSAVEEDKTNLLADCLLTAVKVLMNLTNDNPEGCQQIADCGGLEILSSMIAGHFPSFSSTLPQFDDVKEGSLPSKSSSRINQWNNSPLTDQELDFLVAILGLLVNLVEKDGRNRSQLAATSISLPSPEGLDSCRSNMISLLCSIFLANHGSSEAAGEEKYFSLEDEDSILQGEKEAEQMIVEAYAALLLAFLSTESKSVRNAIAECLPNHSLKILVPVLERFVEFHLTLNVISPETHTAVLEVIESCRMP